MKNLIKFLYKRYCRKEYLFEKSDPLDFSELPKEMQTQYVKACQGYIYEGVLKHLASIRVSAYEADILYNDSNAPVTTTEAELVRQKINGIHEFYEDINTLASIKGEDFDKFSTI